MSNQQQAASEQQPNNGVPDATKRHDPEAGLSEQTPINPQQIGSDGDGIQANRDGSYGCGSYRTRFDPVVIVFALLVFIGGIVGYTAKQSTPSLVSGTIFALLLVACTYFEGSRKNPYPLLVILLALGGMMGYRYIQSSVFMPSGLVALLAFIVFARHSYLIYLRHRNV